MTDANEASLAEFFNQERLWTPTLIEDWIAPAKVRLIKPIKGRSGHSQLEIVWELRVREIRRVRPPSGLLERFMDLADKSDEAIRGFAERFGSLGVYCTGFHFESCDVWRYFATAMLSLLKIAAQEYHRHPGSSADWDAIGKVPQSIHELHFSDNRKFSTESELGWYIAASGVAHGDHRNRLMLVRLVNDLLALGKARPWVRWPKDALRPRIVFSSPGLLSYLALQLALRVTKMNSFFLCTHCQKEYSPTARAPKKGQRRFCPECRAAGIPKQYAISDYRDRKGIVKHVKKTR